jgi:hypothetical protein
MNSGLSVHFYRFLMYAYPDEFRRRFGTSVEQALRDMRRDAFRKHGVLGVALLWFHLVPDFLFSVAELVTKKAGDFLKWRLRLQWVVACSLGFGIARAISLMIGREFYLELEAHGLPGMVLVRVLQISILMASIGAMQAWVLAGRCFRKMPWVIYGVAGAVLGALVLQPVLSVVSPYHIQLIRLVNESIRVEPLRFLADRLVSNAPVWLIFGALTGLLQATAIRSDAISRYQWMGACALGYFLSAMAGGFVIPYPSPSILNLVLTNVVAGTVLGLATCGPLERVLFNIQADSGE